jgi:hypothetical protein
LNNGDSRTLDSELGLEESDQGNLTCSSENLGHGWNCSLIGTQASNGTMSRSVLKGIKRVRLLLPQGDTKAII